MSVASLITSADGKTRRIEWKYLDDQYSPPKTLENVRLLVEQEKVWTVLNPLPSDRLGGVGGFYNGRVYFTQGYSKQDGFAAEAFWGDLSGFGV